MALTIWEIPVILASCPAAIEIKSSATFSESFLEQLRKWEQISSEIQSKRIVVYSGKESFNVQDVSVCSYKDVPNLLQEK